MPIYEYICEECQAITSVFYRKFSDDHLVECEKCHSKSTRKLISKVSYHKSDKSRLEEFDTKQSKNLNFYKDTRNIGLNAKKRIREIGADTENIQKIDEVKVGILWIILEKIKIYSGYI